jgi:hypothetical protein
MRSAAAALLLSSVAHAITLDPYVVVIASGESAAFSMGVHDLQENLYTVTGVAPIVLASPPAPHSLPPQTTVLYFGTTAAAPWLTNLTLPAGCLEGWESHCVAAVPAGSAGTNGFASVVSTGTGLRGALFGLYQFTDTVLGFKPLYLFTDTPAAYVGAANVVINDTLAVVYAPPRFDYRAPFINDEDLTGHHRPDPLGRNVFDLSAWDAYFETALRMKANMVLIGTNPFPDDTATALAARRGLVLASHHYDIVSSNVFSWPLPGDDWNWLTNAGTMAYLWRASIAQLAQYPEVVFSIGLRGLNDLPYPACANPANDKECGQQVTYAIANQTQWIRELVPNATTVLYMWQEILDLLANGYITIPEGTHVVFTGE